MTVTVIDQAGYEDFLQKHRGKVVLVDFWATWCIPCVKLLPHTAELHQRFADRGLVVVTVSLDDPDDPDLMAQVRKVLASKAASPEHFIARPAQPGQPDTDPIQVFDIAGGSLPNLKLYGRDGKVRRVFTSDNKTVEANQIDRAVEEALVAP